MQASRTWEPPGGTLGQILAETRRRLSSLEGAGSRTSRGPRPLFGAALRRDHVTVIAEMKRRSPSRGVLNDALDASLAVEFEKGGAAAVSVLTEPTWFGGSLEDLVAVRGSVRLPVLRKDFHIDPGQLAAARDAGASAVLLIARALAPSELPAMMAAARALELETLVEVRSEAELERAIDAGAEVIGVNSRDLETLEVDERVPMRLLPRIPAHVIAVWESGVRDASDVARAAAAGADAVLVGSALSRSTDAAAVIRGLSNVPRESRAG